MIRVIVDIKDHYIRSQDCFKLIANGRSGDAMIKSPKSGHLISIPVGKFEVIRFSKSEAIDINFQKKGLGMDTSRMDVIGQNGNDGQHYEELQTFRPSYYDLPNRLEDLVKNMPMFHGTACKYVVRAGFKDPSTLLEDLKKGRECLDIEIKRLENETNK